MKCPTGKLRHLDERAALGAQSRMPYGDLLDPYFCAECGGWHLGGRQPQRGKRPPDEFGRYGPPKVKKPVEWHGGADMGTTIGDRLRRNE